MAMAETRTIAETITLVLQRIAKGDRVGRLLEKVPTDLSAVFSAEAEIFEKSRSNAEIEVAEDLAIDGERDVVDKPLVRN
jgi:hypothetical protein